MARNDSARTAVNDRRRTQTAKVWLRLDYVDHDTCARRVVIHRIRRRECDVKGLSRTRAENRTVGRSRAVGEGVAEGAGDVGCRVELRAAKGGAKCDVGGIVPGDR